MNHLFLSSVLIANALCSVGCKTKPSDPPAPLPTATATSTASTLPTAQPTATETGAIPPEHEFLVFEGTVGKRPLRVALDRFQGKVEGVVHLLETDLKVRGEMKDARRIAFSEVGAKAGKGASFDGDIDGSLLRGRWRDPKSKTVVVSAGPPNPFPTKEDAAFEQSYVGTLGSATRIRAKLKKNVDGVVTGVYRYAKSRDDLKLGGSVDAADGKSALLETDAKGALTGQLRMVFLNRNEVFGRWESPDRSRSYPVSLHATPDYPEAITLTAGGKVSPLEDARDPSPFCSISVVRPALVDTRASRIKGRESSLNAALKTYFAFDEAAVCAGAEKDSQDDYEKTYKVTAQRPDLVAFRVQTYVYTGGAHGMHGFSCPIADFASGKLVSLKPSLLTAEGRAALDVHVNTSLRTDESFDYEDEVKVGDATELCLVGENLVVQFQVYEIASYAVGAPTVKVPSAIARKLFVPTPLVDSLFGDAK